MVNKITTPPSQKEIIDKINEVIDRLVSVDTALSTTSENPVQNKIITNALATKLIGQQYGTIIIDI